MFVARPSAAPPLRTRSPSLHPQRTPPLPDRPRWRRPALPRPPRPPPARPLRKQPSPPPPQRMRSPQPDRCVLSVGERLPPRICRGCLLARQAKTSGLDGRGEGPRCAAAGQQARAPPPGHCFVCRDQTPALHQLTVVRSPRRNQAREPSCSGALIAITIPTNNIIIHWDSRSINARF